MVYLPDVFSCLVRMGYAVESNEAILIWESLFGVEDDEKWDVLFSLLKDVQTHRLLLMRILEIVGKNTGISLPERNVPPWIKELDHSTDFITNMAGELLKWEKWSEKFYLRLRKMDLDSLGDILGDEPVDEIKSILDELIEWESKHIRLIEDLMSLD